MIVPAVVFLRQAGLCLCGAHVQVCALYISLEDRIPRVSTLPRRYLCTVRFKFCLDCTAGQRIFHAFDVSGAQTLCTRGRHEAVIHIYPQTGHVVTSHLPSTSVTQGQCSKSVHPVAAIQFMCENIESLYCVPTRHGHAAAPGLEQ